MRPELDTINIEEASEEYLDSLTTEEAKYLLKRKIREEDIGPAIRRTSAVAITLAQSMDELAPLLEVAKIIPGLEDSQKEEATGMLKRRVVEAFREIQDISAVLIDRLTGNYGDEIRNVLWYYGNREHGWEPGGFTTNLIRTIDRADSDNFRKLSNSYPVLARMVHIAKNEEDWEDRLLKLLEV